jgi:phosphoribosylformylglycinamidine synthase subunit PurQ / glutaminase
MTVAITQFLGSNCDRDCLYIFQEILQEQCFLVWHDASELPTGTTAIVIPGGFSYGDYLRCGAIAAHRPLMGAIKQFVEQGGYIIGICNGFQILCEAKILPGVLLPNSHGRFVCSLQEIRVSQGGVGILKEYTQDEKITLPVAHHDGNYYADTETLNFLEKNNQIALRYTETVDSGQARVNGSARGIAGILGGPKNNVLGLMPHPERRAEHRLGGEDGLRMLRGLVHR